MLSGLMPYLLGAGAVILTAIGIYMKGIFTGSRQERDKQARAETKARDIADDVENDVGALTPAQQRERLKQWAKS